ncbi:MAG: Gfo/Idh/MocA family oxidoreductase [Clostridia bacterium]|nr:Gfo/Idh/MocA family oxidoreductase [Clostridia bacterium]
MDIKRIGIIGVGGIACGRHIPELIDVKDCKITAICDIDENRLKTVGDKLYIPEELRFTDYNDLINSPDVDAVEICTPNHLHVPIATAAVKAGKPVNIEKPLSINLAECEPLKCALKENPVKNMMSFTYRFMPAIRYAKWLLDKGLIGDVINVDVLYIKNSGFIKGRRLEWRFEKDKAGTGVLGDLGVHLIDMAELLTGKITAVSAVTDIVVKQRKRLDSEELANVETDDYCSFICDMENGAKGSFVISRCAIGHQGTVKFDVFGTKGIVSFDLNNPNVLNVCYGEVDLANENIHTVDVPQEFFTTQEAEFIKMLQGDSYDILPTIDDGLRSQKILDSILESAEKRCWIEI